MPLGAQVYAITQDGRPIYAASGPGKMAGALVLVVDCHTRELLDWYLSRSSKSKTAETAMPESDAFVVNERQPLANTYSYGIQVHFPQCARLTESSAGFF